MSEPVSAPTAPTQASSEPVLISHSIVVILGALVTLGWVNIPNPVIDSIGTVLALALTGVSAWLTRSKVTPVAKAAQHTA